MKSDVSLMYFSDFSALRSSDVMRRWAGARSFTGLLFHQDSPSALSPCTLLRC